MSKYKIPMRRICNYVVEVESDSLEEAIEEAWKKFGFIIKKQNPQTYQNELRENEIVFKDNEPIIKDNKYVHLTDIENQDLRKF